MARAIEGCVRWRAVVNQGRTYAWCWADLKLWDREDEGRGPLVAISVRLEVPWQRDVHLRGAGSQKMQVSMTHAVQAGVVATQLTAGWGGACGHCATSNPARTSPSAGAVNVLRMNLWHAFRASSKRARLWMSPYSSLSRAHRTVAVAAAARASMRCLTDGDGTLMSCDSGDARLSSLHRTAGMQQAGDMRSRRGP